MTFRDYGLGWDDQPHSEYADLLLALYGSGFTDRRAFSFINIYMYGGGFDMAAALAHKVLPFDLFETRRLVGAAVGVVGLIVAWRIGRRIAGPLGGFIALVLLAVCPLYYGHMFMNPKDVPFAVAMALLLLALVRALEEYPRPSPATIALFGISLGLTLGSRIVGGIAGLYAATAVALVVAEEASRAGLAVAGRRFGRFVLTLVPGLVLGYLVMGLVWPWAVIAPLNPIRATAYFSRFFEQPWKEMFDGAMVLVLDMPRSYVPTLFALKMPEAFVALTLTGIVLAVVGVLRRALPLSRRSVLLLLATASILPIAIAVAVRPAMYNGIRHFVFVMPPLAVLGGLAGAWLFERIDRQGRVAVAAGTTLLVAAIMLPVVEFVRLHPYQYTHFNRIAGGIRMADERYMLDYWGLAFKQAAQEFRQKLAARGESPPAGRHWKIAVCGPHLSASVALGKDFVPTWETKGTDFVLSQGENYCAELKAPVLVEIEREGVVYARVYDIRNRSILSLFTVPPGQEAGAR